jgi:hypothetical protein
MDMVHNNFQFIKINKKHVSCIRKKTFYLKYFIVLVSLKSMLSSSTEFADSTKNHHKFIGTPNQSIRMKFVGTKKP